MARIANDNPTTKNGDADDNVVQPFQLIESDLRGRLVRLGSVVDDILSAHNYPAPVAHVLGEALGLALILASMLKYDGIFTLQTSTDGPVKTLVVDITSTGEMRGYAAFDEDKINEILNTTNENDQDQNRYSGMEYSHLVGNGYLAFTVDQGQHTERYQGIVAVEGESLSQSVQHYFDQSEQIQTHVRVAAGIINDKWRCGALMVQKLPDETSDLDDEDFQQPENVVEMKSDDGLKKKKSEKEEDWNRAVILTQTCTKEEFLSPDLHSSDLLVRLFHEEGITVFEQKHITKSCRCSREKVINVLMSLSPEEQENCFKKDIIEMTCEFCSKQYEITRDDLASQEENES